ncbi:helix-turn-helix domain-containing protein [Aliivibrio salmonicida]|uniref:helix-turn-helix domain-containing protein n=1 Tax=Aliivibrio salmonicida TaxID=40269 RepID=UPI00406D2E0C
MNRNDIDWHSADVKCALAKLDTNMAELARDHQLAPSTLRNIFRFHWPKGERIVAEAIGEKPEIIWPSRYMNKSA